MKAKVADSGQVVDRRTTEFLRVSTFGFVVIALLIAIVLGYVGKRMYLAAGKPDTDYYLKLGELILQLAVIAIIGALAKVFIDWGTTFRTRKIQQNEKRMDFLRRVRAAHVTVETARDLLIAHGSARTYGEQLRRLMALRFDVEEISEDLQATADLFKTRKEMRLGLAGIIAYLKQGAQEYVQHHRDVDAGYKSGETLMQTIESKQMIWVRDLMESGPQYNQDYIGNLSRTKPKMRKETYGA